MTVKSRLLEILEKEKGETLSGEKLAEELLESCEISSGRRIHDRGGTK